MCVCAGGRGCEGRGRVQGVSVSMRKSGGLAAVPPSSLSAPSLSESTNLPIPPALHPLVTLGPSGHTSYVDLRQEHIYFLVLFKAQTTRRTALSSPWQPTPTSSLSLCTPRGPGPGPGR